MPRSRWSRGAPWSARSLAFLGRCTWFRAAGAGLGVRSKSCKVNFLPLTKAYFVSHPSGGTVKVPPARHAVRYGEIPPAVLHKRCIRFSSPSPVRVRLLVASQRYRWVVLHRPMPLPRQQWRFQVAKKVASRRARVRPMQPITITGKHDGTKSLLWTVDRSTLRTVAHVYMYTKPKAHRNMSLLALHGNNKVLSITATLTRAPTRYQVPVLYPRGSPE